MSTAPSTHPLPKQRDVVHTAVPLAIHRITLRWWWPDGTARWSTRRRPAPGEQSGACRRTTSRPRSRCSAPCCCRATPSARSASRACAPEDFYRPGHQHIFDAVRALYSIGRAGRHDHRRRRAAPCRAARAGRRHRGAARPAERHAGDLQRRPLRPHRPGHGPAAPPDPRRRRHRRDRLRRARRRHQGRRRGRVQGVQGRRAARHRLHAAAQRVDQGRDGPPRGDVRPRRHHHRHRHRLPRPRRAAVGAAALDAEHRRRPPGDGQDGLRAGHGHPRGPDDGQAGARVLAGDGPQRADPADPVQRGPGRLDEDAQRPAQPRPTGPRSAGRSAASRCRCSSTTTRG